MAVRLGFVGTGGIANRHLSCAREHPDMEIVATCDVIKERADEAAAKYGGNAYADFVEMYDKESPDAIVVCTPPFAHGDIEAEAARRGIHIFVEKPVAISMEMAKGVLDAVRDAGIICQVGYMFRLSEPIRHVQQMLSTRAIAMVQEHYYMPGLPNKGWWTKMEMGGGQLVEQATHMLDLGRFLAGDVKSVIGKTSQVRSWDPPADYEEPEAGLVAYKEGFEIPDTTALIMEFESGAMGTLSCTLIPQVAWDNGFKVVAEDCLVTIDSANASWTNEDGEGSMEAPGDWANAVLIDFIEAVKSGGGNAVPYEEGVKSLAISLAGYLSAERGSVPVELAEILPEDI
ncbi:MAG: Gfo/Idh/MocA family oxidoreductase [Armatimonadetes bacterium]|nr:Gfo/Idh/MocA family oxidoreductase [Armatimonadota bacterium]